MISSVVVSTCESERGSCGIDMVDSTWDAATSGADRDGTSIVQCTAELPSHRSSRTTMICFVLLGLLTLHTAPIANQIQTGLWLPS